MGEIKHGFTGGKMNKDLDERLVRQGEYRDAMNIQVRTTTGGGEGDGIGDAGVVQNLQGNVSVGTATGDVLSNSFTDAEFTCIGSIAHEKTDSAYFFFTTDIFIEGDYTSATEIVKIDTIIQHNVSTGANTPIVVDRWGLQTPIANVWGNNDGVAPNDPIVVAGQGEAPTGTITKFNIMATLSAKIREGMTIEFTDSADDSNFATVKIKKIDSNTIHLYDQINTADATWANFTHARFTHPRALGFDKKQLITGINIIDNLLFWTDSQTEPKKINIDRCKEGTSADGTSHTKLFITNPNNEELEDAGSLELNGLNSDLLEEHITVLRPAPKTPPTVHTELRDDAELSFAISEFYNEDSDGNQTSLWGLNEDTAFMVGDTVFIGSTTNDGGEVVLWGDTTPDLVDIPFQDGDVFVVSQEEVEEGFTPIIFKVKFLGYYDGDTPQLSNVPTNLIKVEIITEPNNLPSGDMHDWSFKFVEAKDSKFELKFPRFAYRYKYEDGEYSAFSPFSELAFDPGLFDYDPVKGYNLGMVNTIKKITIKDFIPYYTDRALDIVEIEILYKSTDSPNIYTIKSIKKIRDGEWELFTPDGNADDNNSTQSSIETGALEIKSETIHRVLPSNQTLRTFDNVPRYALAQEITGSRILYGNFVQGFDIKYPVGLDQNVTSETVNGQPKRSVKTIRDYKVGMVFGDLYGRETPVIVSNKITEGLDMYNQDTFFSATDELTIPKELCAKSNKLSVKQVWDKPGLPGGDPSSMTWMEYVKYYVKETSNEYYNLVLDRWYKAKKENNIWLSFPSADRNKVDLETYLYLKKAHGTDDAILDKARYKIIDIKNEAPDFIKTDIRNLGLVNITGNPTDAGSESPIGAADPQINEPFLLTSPTNTRIEVPAASWQGFLNLYGENKRGQLFVRVVGRTENIASGGVFNQLNSGDFKKVTHHYVKPAQEVENEVGVVTYDSSFLGSADMVDRFAANGFAIDGDCSTQCLQYYFEFKEEVIENKPEFDGRFFVLIEKDETTEEQIELTTTNTLTFSEIFQFRINYVDSQQFTPAKQGPYSNGGDTAPYEDIYGATGLMTNFVAGQTDGVNNTLTDVTQPHEWWGFGRFSETEPNTTHTFQNNDGDDDTQYDSRQAHFFALGCNHAWEEHNGVPVADSNGPNNYDGEPIDMNMIGTINYAGITRDYWRLYKMFHKSSISNGYQNTGAGNQNIANNHLVFLDGARANQFHLLEYGTNIDTTEQQGVMTVYEDSEKILSNDSISEGGNYEYAPTIFNYKPTALDEGHAEQGLGRMVFSRIGGWSTDDDDAVAGAIYNYFGGPSASGTYFSFMDDESDDGDSHIYKVITVHPEDDDIILPIQKTAEGSSRNFGYLQTAGSANCGGWDNPEPQSTTLNIWSSLDYGSGNYSNLNYSGENWSGCADEFGNTGGAPCWEGLNDAFGPAIDVGDGGAMPNSHTIRVGVFANNDGGGEGDVVDGDPCNHRFNKICYKCKTGGEGGGPYADYKVCGRESIRFEFRRVDKETGLVTNIGIIPEEFDPRGWAKHDGTHGGIRIKIVKPGVIDGGEEIEVEEDRAVWETEPKEDADLDLYYEATHALPIRLKEGNLFSYAPLKSKVYTESVNLMNGNVTLNDQTTNPTNGEQYFDVMVGGGEYLEDGVIVKILSSSVTVFEEFGLDGPGIHNFGIGIGDTIVFEHKSGLQTKSVVEDYYVAPTGGANCTFVPQTSYTGYNLSYTAFDNTFAFTATTDTTNFVNGMNLTHPDLPPGLFINSYVAGGGETIWQVVGWPQGGPNVWFNNANALITGATVTQPTGYYKIDKDVYKYEVKLGWHNCYSFGNGVESDRIRDDFNAPQIDNGVRVSTTLNEYGKEKKSSSLIFSGLYNTTSGVNDLNEFNMGEKIIKDLNPEYGTVQVLKTRDTNVVVFCEDRILKVQANKEAVFMADNDPNIVATDRVLGTVSTFLGDYGISRNPESLAKDNYRLYCTDSQRGAVLRVSMDGITPISNVGMKTWFRENIIGTTGYGTRLLGTFDSVNGEYNLGVSDQTMVSFNEGGKGWVSFKSFIPDQGVSVSGKYLTVKRGNIYEHYVDTFDDDGKVNNRNLFYGATELTSAAESSITIMFNDIPGQVKSFKAMNYEGSQARIDQDLTNASSDYQNEYYNLIGKQGWWAFSIQTDLQDGKIKWFVDKENKWFNRICGIRTNMSTLDTSEFTVQGIGSPTNVELPPAPPPTSYTFTIENNTDNDEQA